MKTTNLSPSVLACGGAVFLTEDRKLWFFLFSSGRQPLPHNFLAIGDKRFGASPLPFLNVQEQACHP